MKKKTILFIGAFNTTKAEGKTGGQLFACNSLINSNLSEEFIFIKLDSTWASIKKNSFFNRFLASQKRLITFFYTLLTKRFTTILVFTSYGTSFIEKGLMILLAKWFGKKTIMFPRSGFLKIQIEKKIFYKLYFEIVAHHTDVLLCQSKSWQFFFKEYIKNQNIELIIQENWLTKVNTENFFLKKSREAQIKIFFYNRIEIEKGIYDFLDAVDFLSNYNINFHVSIFGDGNEVSNIKYYIEEKKMTDSVSYLGWIFEDEKAQTFSNYDLYVFSSHFEGFPNSLLEIMNFGIPVISSKVGAVPDIIEDGYNGYLFEVGDYHQIAKRIYDLYINPDLAKLFSERSLNRLNLYNSLDKAVENFSHILNTD